VNDCIGTLSEPEATAMAPKEGVKRGESMAKQGEGRRACN
jgi:hypothetical protein